MIKIIQSNKLNTDHEIKPLPKKQQTPISKAWYSRLTKRRYQYLIFVMPATRQIASSGMHGRINKIGSQNLDFRSIRFCASFKLFSPTNLRANFSPNLSPIKNKIVVEKNMAIMFAMKAVFEPNKTIPRTVRDTFKKGTKHKHTNMIVRIAVYTIIENLPLFVMMFLNAEMFAIPQAFKIKYRATETAAKVKITKKIFIQFFIVYAMTKNCFVLIKKQQNCCC